VLVALVKMVVALVKRVVEIARPEGYCYGSYETACSRKPDALIKVTSA
jgi:hypothetical protein